MKLKIFAALLTALAISLSFTAWATAANQATEDEITADITDAPDVSEDISASGGFTNLPDFDIIFIDDVNGDYQDGYKTMKSFADISTYLEKELYYPDFDTLPIGGLLSVLYNQRYYVAHGDKTQSGSFNNLQFNYMNDVLEHFWIDIDYIDSYYEPMPEDSFYNAHGGEFLIRKNIYSASANNAYLVKGSIEGNTYSFTACSAETAKLIIDSLKKQ
ncbi:MAG: hypothetical protein IKU23_08415 [Clostridia bacterium]|nr:hypothetical protein [Clostridia bacterium]